MPRRSGPQQKADALLGRFPVTDLSQAVARSGEARVNFLRGFVNGFPKGSFRSLRAVTPRIYGVQMPLLSLHREEWASIEKTLCQTTEPAYLEANLARGSELFQHAREEEYDATYTSSQVFRYGRGTAAIGLEFYLTKGERLLFQFPHFRSVALKDREALVLCSIISHAYAVGDFAEAEAEIVQFAKTRRNRVPHVICPERSELLDRDALNREIDDVYAILRKLAEEPR